MPRDIAVFVNEKGEATSLYNSGTIKVFRNKQGNWNQIRETVFGLDKSLGLKDLRKSMEAAISFLEDCRIFVAASVVGVPYFALEKAEFSIWEFEGHPEQFLDYIVQKEEETKAEEKKEQANIVIPFPVELGDGIFQISLQAIQESNSGITSKQVLMPFLRKGNFYELQVICSHVPPWLEAELITGNLEARVEKVNTNEVRLYIKKRTCQD